MALHQHNNKNNKKKRTKTSLLRALGTGLARKAGEAIKKRKKKVKRVAKATR